MQLRSDFFNDLSTDDNHLPHYPLRKVVFLNQALVNSDHPGVLEDKETSEAQNHQETSACVRRSYFDKDKAILKPFM